MLCAKEVTITYKLYALDDNDALEQVFNLRVEPEKVDVSDLPVSPTPEVVIPNF